MNPGSAGALEDTSRFQMLPACTGRQGRPFADDRTRVEAIIHRDRCFDPVAGPARGLRALAESCGPGTAAWPKRAPGTRCWQHGPPAADAEILIDWSVSVDSTIARAHQHARNTTRLRGAGSNDKESA